MSIKSTILKAGALGAVVTALSAGAAFAAVATGSVNVRSGPSTGYSIVDQLRAGQQVNVVDRAGSWCEVSKPGRDGWVACSYLSANSPGRYARGPSRGPDFGYDYDDSPDVTFSFGIGGGSVGYGPGHPPRGPRYWPGERMHRDSSWY